MSLYRRSIQYIKRKRRVAVFTRDPTVRRFLAINRAFWKQQGAFNSRGRRVLLVEEAYGTDYPSLALSISAAILAGAYQAEVIYLFEGQCPQDEAKAKIQRTFSSCRFESAADLTEARRDALDAEAQAIFESLQTPADVLGITYQGIPIGEQIYDGVLKRKQSTIWQLDARVLEKIRGALAMVEAVAILHERYEIQAGLYGHVTCEGSGVAARAILQLGRPVFLGRGGLTALKRYNRVRDDRGRLTPQLYVPNAWIDALAEEQRAELIQKADHYMAEQMAGKYTSKLGQGIYAPENNYYASAEEFCQAYGLDPDKPCVFVMLHVMNDDPHGEEQHIFNDYYDWFVRTLDVVKEVPDVNWVFKQHPLYRDYYKADTDVGSIIAQDNAPHIAYLDEYEPFHSASMPHVAHALITCGGTAGLEYTAHGIPAITGSRCFYYGYGISAEPATFEEYATLLRTIRSLPPPTPEQRRMAKLVYYASVVSTISGLRYRDGILPDVADWSVRAHTQEERLQGISDVLAGPRRPELIQRIQAMQRFVYETEGSEAVEDLYLTI